MKRKRMVVKPGDECCGVCRYRRTRTFDLQESYCSKKTCAFNGRTVDTRDVCDDFEVKW